ncbi:flagellar export chaperone FliS [Ectobacillus sp. sgz5001026]|uniref:flagellar export chaperone FliS n=1 Tax=Ectobacillus sp. sgz5001026 TaxID=3242473 RepID=UPI0036D31F3F
MINKPNPYDVYKQNQVVTSRPEDLTLMLYNGGVKFLLQAKQAMQQQDLPKAHTLIIRAQDIINELLITLNPDYEITNQLAPLYEYMKARLVEANLKKDITYVEEVEGMFKELRDTWSQAMKSLSGRQ